MYLKEGKGRGHPPKKPLSKSLPIVNCHTKEWNHEQLKSRKEISFSSDSAAFIQLNGHFKPPPIH